MNAATLIVLFCMAQHGGAPPKGDAAPATAPTAPPASLKTPNTADSAGPSTARAGVDHTVQVRPGYAWDLLAAEPLVADPVAFTIDEQGRIFVAESERQEKGVEDNRHCTWWLFDDLSNQTVEDRLRMFTKWSGKFDGGMDHFTRWADRVRVLVDPDAQGRPTRAVNFSGDMRDPLDGTNAGVLARDGEVWCTNIPNLWRFRDTDGDGVADERDRVHTGFGVRIALRGHDMHGLTFGPDGRLYWSIGDRGYHLTLPDGRVIADPKSGAVFRCEPDGSNLEVFCTGLRNPQELAFNRYGDLFTGDNNSDAGDKARIVWCVDGGETGWDMNYQTLEGSNQRGPWNQERIWWLRDPNDPAALNDPIRPAWTLPPVAHVGSGPSGLVSFPGVGLDERYRDAMFLCDFLGDARASRVLAMKVERAGAGYTVSDVHPFVSEVLPTDVDFDYAGHMVISDWDEGWESNGKGQLYRVWDPRFVDTTAVREVTDLMRQGFSQRPDAELGRLLANGDMRVRLRAQWELAKRFPASVTILAPIARADLDACRAAGVTLDAIPLEARLHAIWGLGQQLRSAAAAQRAAAASATESRTVDAETLVSNLRATIDGAASLGNTLLALLSDEDPEVRTQVARVLGDAANPAALEPLIALATDEEPRVRMAAATALGRIGSKEAIPALVAILWENEDVNPYLRHAASLALARIGDREKLLELAADQFPQVRMGAVLALRRLGDPALARSLFDPDRRIATEAARAIHDLPIPEARPALIAMAERWAATGAPATTAQATSPAATYRREVWRPMPKAAELDLMNHPVFDRAPTMSQELTEFAGPRDDGNLYVQRISGIYTAPMSGAYRFAISSDDGAVLIFGPESNPRLQREIARVVQYVQPDDFDSQGLQQTPPIELKAGERYMLEARHAQGGGASHCSVRVLRPDGSMEAPIGRLPQPNLDAVPLLRRVIDECLRDGSARSAEALLGIASSGEVPLLMRVEAMESLRLFADPVARRPSVSDGSLVPSDPPIMRDRVNGHVRPVDRAARDIDGYRRALATRLPDLAAHGPTELRALARLIAEEQEVPLDASAALAMLRDPSAAPRERALCLQQLVRQGHSELESLIAMALASDQPALRMSAREALVRFDADRAIAELRRAVADGALEEQQAALASLARVERSDADAVLASAIDAAMAPRTAPGTSAPANAWSAALDLDLFEAATHRAAAAPALAAALARWRTGAPTEGAPLYLDLALEGGDAERGREIVNFHSAAACLRCHVVGGHGGNAAPALDGVGGRLARIDLLKSLVEPNATIAEHYTAPSAMPDMTTLLTPREARDVVAFLSTLR